MADDFSRSLRDKENTFMNSIHANAEIAKGKGVPSSPGVAFYKAAFENTFVARALTDQGMIAIEGLFSSPSVSAGAGGYDYRIVRFNRTQNPNQWAGKTSADVSAGVKTISHGDAMTAASEAHEFYRKQSGAIDIPSRYKELNERLRNQIDKRKQEMQFHWMRYFADKQSFKEYATNVDKQNSFTDAEINEIDTRFNRRLKEEVQNIEADQPKISTPLTQADIEANVTLDTQLMESDGADQPKIIRPQANIEAAIALGEQAIEANAALDAQFMEWGGTEKPLSDYTETEYFQKIVNPMMRQTVSNFSESDILKDLNPKYSYIQEKGGVRRPITNRSDVFDSFQNLIKFTNKGDRQFLGFETKHLMSPRGFDIALSTMTSEEAGIMKRSFSQKYTASEWTAYREDPAVQEFLGDAKGAYRYQKYKTFLNRNLLRRALVESSLSPLTDDSQFGENSLEVMAERAAFGGFDPDSDNFSYFNYNDMLNQLKDPLRRASVENLREKFIDKQLKNVEFNNEVYKNLVRKSTDDYGATMSLPDRSYHVGIDDDGKDIWAMMKPHLPYDLLDENSKKARDQAIEYVKNMNKSALKNLFQVGYKKSRQMSSSYLSKARTGELFGFEQKTLIDLETDRLKVAHEVDMFSTDELAENYALQVLTGNYKSDEETSTPLNEYAFAMLDKEGKIITPQGRSVDPFKDKFVEKPVIFASLNEMLRTKRKFVSSLKDRKDEKSGDRFKRLLAWGQRPTAYAFSEPIQDAIEGGLLDPEKGMYLDAIEAGFGEILISDISENIGDIFDQDHQSGELAEILARNKYRTKIFSNKKAVYKDLGAISLDSEINKTLGRLDITGKQLWKDELIDTPLESHLMTARLHALNLKRLDHQRNVHYTREGVRNEQDDRDALLATFRNMSSPHDKKVIDSLMQKATIQTAHVQTLIAKHTIADTWSQTYGVLPQPPVAQLDQVGEGTAMNERLTKIEATITTVQSWMANIEAKKATGM